ncbi:hypothetical protein KAH81_01005 [bacterium]|nr:hypothetical protein [bacterium]
MKLVASIVVLSFLLAVFPCLSQTVQRPPRPGEEPVGPTDKAVPVLDRDYHKTKKIEPSFGGSAGVIIYPSGTVSSINGGIKYGKWELGVELGYVDYERTFAGSKVSYISPGDSTIYERGSFLKPALYAEYEIGSGCFSIVPKAKLGFANMVCRRYYDHDRNEPSRFERDRLINSFGVDFRFSLNHIGFALCVEWIAINPWFYIVPEDFGIVSTGLAISY